MTLWNMLVEMISHYFYCVLMVRSKSQILPTLKTSLHGTKLPGSRDSLGAFLRVPLSQTFYCFSLGWYSHLHLSCFSSELTPLPLPTPASHPVFPDLVSRLVCVQSSTLERKPRDHFQCFLRRFNGPLGSVRSPPGAPFVSFCTFHRH